MSDDNKDNEDSEEIKVPTRLRISLRVCDLMVAALVVLAGTCIVLYGFPHVTRVPPPPPLVPHGNPPLAFPTTSPIHSVATLAVAVGTAFLVMLFAYADLSYPILDWVKRRKEKNLSPDIWKAWMRGTFQPSLSQGRIRMAVLVAGIIGELLWLYGTNGFEFLRTVRPLLLSLGVVGLGMETIFIGKFSAIFRHGLAMFVTWFAFGCALSASQWTTLLWLARH